MITLAEKGKPQLSYTKHEYAKKVLAFLTDNNFYTLTDNPTKKDQIWIQKTAQ